MIYECILFALECASQDVHDIAVAIAILVLSLNISLPGK